MTKEDFISSFFENQRADRRKTVDKKTGKKIWKYTCPKDFKVDKSGAKPVCVKMAAKEIIAKQKASKKMVRNKKAQGGALAKKIAKAKRKTMIMKKRVGLK